MKLLKLLMIAACLPAASLNASVAMSAATVASASRAVSEVPLTIPAKDAALAGTLYLPAGPGPHPAVVLIHGSGPQTRGWPYVVHAADFARRGIATLIYDKRGTGQSTGTYSEAADFEQLADDAAAAVRLLAGDPRIRKDRIGVWGRSQGAWIAPMVAARTSDVAFAVLVVGGGVTVQEQNLFAARRRLEKAGYSTAEIDTVVSAQAALGRYLTKLEGRDEAETELARIRANPRLAAAPNDLLNRLTRVPPPEWVRANQNTVLAPLKETLFDPAPLLAKMSVPTLALLAGEDTLTPTAETSRRLERALADRPGSLIAVFPGADHTMCPAVPDKDYQPGCRFIAGYESLMGDWIERTAKASR